MEEESTTRKPFPLPKVLGVAGFILALASIGVGIVALNKAQKTVVELNGKIEKAAALSLDMKKTADRIDALAMQIENMKTDNGKVDILSRQMKNYLEGVGKILQEDRTLIEENRKAIQTLAENASKISKRAQPTSVSQSTADNSKSESATPAKESTSNIYKVKSGDSFSKIAKIYGVSISAIQNLNPNIDSSKLRIGQEIIVPEK